MQNEAGQDEHEEDERSRRGAAACKCVYAESLSREQIREFLKSSERIEFTGCGRKEKYTWVERVPRAQNYGKLGKRERGVVRAYVRKVTGMSEAQTTRLVRAFLDQGVVKAAAYQRHRGPTRYRGCGAAGGSGPCPRAVERAGHTPHTAARVRAVWGRK